MDEPQKIDAVIRIAHDQVAIVVQPGNGPLHLPALFRPAQRNSTDDAFAHSRAVVLVGSRIAWGLLL